MAFAGDVKAFLQLYLSVGDSSVEAELPESGFFWYIFFNEYIKFLCGVKWDRTCFPSTAQ